MLNEIKEKLQPAIKIMTSLLYLLIIFIGAVLVLIFMWMYAPAAWVNNDAFAMSLGAGIISGMIIIYLSKAQDWYNHKLVQLFISSQNSKASEKEHNSISLSFLKNPKVWELAILAIGLFFAYQQLTAVASELHVQTELLEMENEPIITVEDVYYDYLYENGKFYQLDLTLTLKNASRRPAYFMGASEGYDEDAIPFEFQEVLLSASGSKKISLKANEKEIARIQSLLDAKKENVVGFDLNYSACNFEKDKCNRFNFETICTITPINEETGKGKLFCTIKKHKQLC